MPSRQFGDAASLNGVFAAAATEGTAASAHSRLPRGLAGTHSPYAVANAAMIESLAQLLVREAESLIAGSEGSDEQLADLHVRLALISWDVLDDGEATVRYLELADKHPVAWRLMLAHGITEARAAHIEAAHSIIDQVVSDERARAAALREVAEAWLYRFGDHPRATEVARMALELRGDPETAAELQHLYILSLSAAEEWGELGAALAEAATHKRAGAHTIAEAVHLLYDRLDDATGAAELLGRTLERLERTASPEAATLHAARVLDLALELLDVLGEHPALDRVDLLRRRLALLEGSSNGAADAAALRYEISAELAKSDAPAAVALLDQLVEPEPGTGGWGGRLAAQSQARLGRRHGDFARAVAALRTLGRRPGGGDAAGAYLWRAAEISDARAGDDQALELWRAVARTDARTDDSGEQAARAIERLLLDAPPEQLTVYLEELSERDRALRSVCLRRAAAVAESRQRDLSAAMRLYRAAHGGEGDVAGHEALLRVHRQQREVDALAAEYRALAAAYVEPRAVATALCACGMVELARDQLDAAEEAFVAAAGKAPKDPLARAALAGIYRHRKRWEPLAPVLVELAELAVSEETRISLFCELGNLYSRELGDGLKARESFEKALELDSDNGITLHALAELYDRAGEWSKSIKLRERAVAALDDDARRSVVLLELGNIEETHRADPEAALRAYERAFELDTSNIAALRAQQAVHREHGNMEALLAALRVELERQAEPPTPDRQLEIQLEIASTLRADGAQVDGALAAYRAALEVEPANAVALAGLEQLARESGSWKAMAEAFGRAPSTTANLRNLAEALEQLEDWPGFAQVRLQEIDLAGADADRARLAHALGEVYETKLGDIDNAIAMFQRALDTGVAAHGTQQSLIRLLEEHRRWPALEKALERELASTPAGKLKRQVELLLRLGELRRDKLDRAADAALAFEAILEREPHHVAALEALEALYQTLERQKDLLRVLETRADSADTGVQRAELYARVAAIKQEHADTEGAIAAYREAFSANPADRNVFTLMEKLCYKHERWSEALELYQTAIALVEDGNARAYRLGDLYARRGQVQLQYMSDLSGAAQSYVRVLKIDPDNDHALKCLESIHSQQSDWSGLIKVYETRAELMRDHERRLETLRRAARVAAAKLKSAAEAARIFELILRNDPADREALDALERYYERAQDWSKLVDVLKRRLAASPAGEDATVLLRRIAQICEEGLRDEQRAVEHYLRMLEIAPGSREALEALGRIYESTEQWTDFIDVTRRQIRVTNDRGVKALLYFKCGSVMEAKFNKEEDAIRYYDAAIKTSFSCLPAVHGLRDLHRRHEDWPRVIQTLELEVKLWQEDKERAGVFAQIGRIYADQLGQPERAMHYYESALAVDPECLPANKALFEQYFGNGDWERAQNLAQALAQKAMREGDPTARSEFYRKRGIVAWMTGDLRAGAESLIISLELKPTNMEALDALGELAKANGDAYDFEATYRELEKIYKKRDDAHPYLARVRVGQAFIKEREGDLDAAEERYAEATELCPADFTILSALVELHANMRRWTHATEAIVRFLESEPAPSDEVRLRALMRQAELHADGEMDSHRAISVLREVVRLEPNHQEAHYRLAQEYFALQRWGEARAAVDRCIELATVPGSTVEPETLARFYFYLGRVLEAAGDGRAAAAQYRRAAEYDPGYAPPALALARRATEAADQRQAETLLINAAHAAMGSGGPSAAVPLQRGLARILLASGDRPAAIEAYRGILNVDPANATDRVALAEIYALDDPRKAISELRKVIERDLRHAPAYRMLASFYTRVGEPEHATRALTVMEMLGFADGTDRASLAKTRAMVHRVPLRRSVDDELRDGMLATEAVRGPVGEIYSAIAEEIAGLFPQPLMGENLVPMQTLEDPTLRAALADTSRLFGIEADVYLGERVPTGAVLVSFPRPIIVIDREILTQADAERRYLLGWAFEAVRGGYALLYSLSRRQRIELGSLLASLLLPEGERAGPTNEFIRSLPKRAAKLIESHAGSGWELDIDTWIEGMMASAKRAGLLACDDFAAAVRMIARLSGETAGVGDEDTVGLGAVLGGADLLRFYLADDYHRLRDVLSNPSPSSAA